MKCLFNVSLFLFLRAISAKVKITVDPVDLISSQGYPVEKYTIQTEDGYLLSTYRIPYGINGIRTNRKPILVNHGMGASCADYLILNRKRSLGFVLADHGYDVWLMNCRGTTYSNKHISINETINKKEFYDFSWHQIGYFDIPANVDFILQKTNHQKLQYIGHSQGGTTFLVMASTRPEYNAKISLATLLAPAAIMKNVHPLTIYLADYHKNILYYINYLNVYDVPNVDYIRGELHSICSNTTNKKATSLCNSVYNFVGGYPNPKQVDREIFENIFKSVPSNIALKQSIHFLQNIKTGEFRHFDYGVKKNLEIYNSTYPPDYNLDKITAPVSLYAGKNDQLVGAKDVEALSQLLKNMVNFKVVPNPLWNHLDFLYAIEIEKYLYEDMLNIMALY